MLNRVCDRFAAEHPKVPLLTIHDSLLVPPEFAETVAATIRGEAAKLGISPTIKIDGLPDVGDNAVGKTGVEHQNEAGF